MREANVVPTLDLGDQLFPVFIQRGGIDFTGDEEVRNGGPALCRSFGHDAAERTGNLDASRSRRAAGDTRARTSVTRM